MSGLYWYVSRQKVEALKTDYAPNRFGWLKEISLKLKSPFAEASATTKSEHTLFDDVERVRTSLLSGPSAPTFPDLQWDGTVAFFSFSGHAHRAVEAGAFWVLSYEGTSALLLAGSVSNAVGAPGKTSEQVSPSIDPVGAVRQAFGEKVMATGALNRDVGADCSYVWQAMARPVRDSWNNLPRVEGIAAYAGTFKATKSQFARAGFPPFISIVVGTPIYVRQT